MASSASAQWRLCIMMVMMVVAPLALVAQHASASPPVLGPAERLIRALNLFPDSSLRSQRFGSGGGGEGPPLVERPLHLSVMDESGSFISTEDLGHHAGYYQIKGTYAARMFYMFFESREKKAEDPVVLWMSGGPGCSSELALFYENGPFKITDNLTLVWNDHGWDKASSIIFVDQPIGTGFSYSTDIRDMRHDEIGVSEDMYSFLQAFFEAHPEFASNEFYVTGESYAGHYVPAVASRIHKGNKANEGLLINLKGFAIGNGLTDPEIQYEAYADYALKMNMIGQTEYGKVTVMYPACKKAIESCETGGSVACATAYVVCSSIFSSIMSIARGVNYYDIRKSCTGSLCYDFSNMETYLNQQSVKDDLGVGNQTFVSCSPLVYRFMIVDWMKNLEVGIPTLLEDGIKLLVYAGEYDFICNWLGNSRWVTSMDWSGKENYAEATLKSFVVDGEEAGVFKQSGPLTFLKVHDAGHMVPMDQPKASLEMLRRFTKGVPLDDELVLKKVVADDENLYQ